jgi:hypothetical protein
MLLEGFSKLLLGFFIAGVSLRESTNIACFVEQHSRPVIVDLSAISGGLTQSQEQHEQQQMGSKQQSAAPAQ